MCNAIEKFTDARANLRHWKVSEDPFEEHLQKDRCISQRHYLFSDSKTSCHLYCIQYSVPYYYTGIVRYTGYSAAMSEKLWAQDKFIVYVLRSPVK